MRQSPINLLGGFYKDDTLPWSAQDTVNWLPELAEVNGTLTVMKLATPPGLRPYIEVGSGPIRGMHDLEGGRYVVSGQTLCRINPNMTVDPLGTIPGVERVAMAHNQFKTGYQLLVVNGQGGGGYVYDTNDNTLTRVTDEAFPGAISIDYLDSYIVGVEPFGRYWFNSDLADAEDYNSLDRYEAEDSPDKIVGLAVSRGEVVVFGERTIEFFYNAGTATGTFQNRKTSITRGCASRHTIQKLDNTLFWLGDDGIVYRLEGYSAMPVSTRPIDKQLRGFDLSLAYAMVWEDGGHKIYYLTLPNGQTWGYDVITKLWTRRESKSLTRWRVNHLIKWGSKWYGGDSANGRIWELDWLYHLEGLDEMVSRRVSGVNSDDENRFIIRSLQLRFSTGEGYETVPSDFPNTITIGGYPPPAYVGTSYPEFTFVGGDGVGPYVFSVSRGTLPSGLTLSSSGALTGFPNLKGTYYFTVRAFDSRGAWTEKDISLEIKVGMLALATPPMMLVGGYESLVTTNQITNRTPARRGAFAINPSATYAYIGLSSAPWGVLCKYNATAGAWGESTDISFTPSSAVRSCSFSPDGVHMAIVTGPTSAQVLSLLKFESGTWNVKSTDTMPSACDAMEFSPDGTKLACVQTNNSPEFGMRVYRINQATSTLDGFVRPPSASNAQNANGFGWHPNSELFAEWNNNRLTIRRVTQASIGTVSQVPIGGVVASANGAFFSSDGNFVYYAGGVGDSYAIGAAPCANGVLGTSVAYPGIVPFSISDTSFSGGYMAVGRNGNSPTLPPLVILKVSGASVQVAQVQPSWMQTVGVVAVRWTI